MTHRRAVSVLWLLLPLLVARAMLPAGYMPTAGVEGMHLVMCSGVVLVPSGDGAPAPRAHEGDLSCPFAHAAAFAPPPVPQIFHMRVAAAFVVLPPQAHRPPATGPPRNDRARGPPALS